MMFVVIGIAPQWMREDHTFAYREKYGTSHNQLPHQTIFTNREVAQKNADSWNKDNRNEWTYVVKELV